MGSVVISPNIKKTSIKINPNGDEITDFKTKRVVKKEAPEYIPPPPHVLEAWKEEKKEKNPTEERLEQLNKTQPLSELLEAVAQKRAKDMVSQIDNRTAEILKDLLK